MTRELPDDWREQLHRAHRIGREDGGMPCCGSPVVIHLPLCPMGTEKTSMTVAAYFGVEDTQKNEKRG